MPAAATPVLALAQTLSDLVPYLVMMFVGFLVGAWGQSAKAPLAVALGIILILLAAALFVLGNDSGGSGAPSIGMVAPLI
jgi:CHASE2 domain-containing sensor protein